jgi:hypothetical protein
LPHVQFWETENSWRLDSSYRGGDRRDIPCLVDASDVRAVNALKTIRLGVEICDNYYSLRSGQLPGFH